MIDRTLTRMMGDNPPTARLLYGQDVRDSLKMLDDHTVQMVATSPPYWGLRDYKGTPSVWGGDPNCDHEWSAEDFCQHCDGWFGQLGLEPTPQLFTKHIVEVFEGVRRVLRKDGVVWLNLGDSYLSNGGQTSHGANSVLGSEAYKDAQVFNRQKMEGLKPKNLVGIPWRVALALQDAGWYLRNDIIWHKLSCMPESTQDRCTKAHEYVFLLAHPDSGGDYFYDTHAIREGDMSTGGRNKRTVWTVNPKGYPGAHFAVWPEKLVEPMIKAGSSEYGCCSKCRAPYQRILETVGTVTDKWGTSSQDQVDARLDTISGGKEMPGLRHGIRQIKDTAGWEPTCECEGADVIPCLVLDTFSGSATTGAVAWKHGRSYIGTDLQPDYLELAVARLEGKQAPKKDQAEVKETNLIGDLFG